MIHKVGQRIGALRKERNMSQEELASILHISRQTISKWETGDTLPDIFNAVALANLFHVTLDTLILGSKFKSTNTSYMVELRETRQRINLKAMIVGGIGSTLFALSIILSKALGINPPIVGYIFAVLIPLLMILWGYAIWGLIRVGRIGDELKYLESLEIESLRAGKE